MNATAKARHDDELLTLKKAIRSTLCARTRTIARLLFSSFVVAVGAATAQIVETVREPIIEWYPLWGVLESELPYKTAELCFEGQKRWYYAAFPAGTSCRIEWLSLATPSETDGRIYYNGVLVTPSALYNRDLACDGLSNPKETNSCAGTIVCPDGYAIASETLSLSPQSYRFWCIKQQKEPDRCDVPGARPKDSTPHPVAIAGGEKFLSDTDGGLLPPVGFVLSRSYRSDLGRWQWQHESFGVENSAAATVPSTACVPLIGGTSKKQSFCFKVAKTDDAFGFALHRADGRVVQFSGTSSYAASADIDYRVTKATDTGGATLGFDVKRPDDAIERYDTIGRLSKITLRNGQSSTLTYSATNTKQLLSVVDSYNRSLTFTYHPANAAAGAGNIATVADHLGNVVSYGYDANNNLVTVTYPPLGGAASGTKTYHYNEQAFTANTNLPNALTGITDENGVRYATYQYDASGRAISTEHAGGVNKYSLNYTSPYSQTIVTDPLGTARTYNFQTILGVVKTTDVDQPCPSCGGSQSQATTCRATSKPRASKVFHLLPIARLNSRRASPRSPPPIRRKCKRSGTPRIACP
jgi:YD repeat-containing protein